MKAERKHRRLVPDEPTPPGEHLADTLRELDLTQSELARRMGRPQQVINEIVRGVKSITAETALQLEGVLGMSAEMWMNLQTNYELAQARNAAKKKIRASGVLRPRSRPTPS